MPRPGGPADKLGNRFELRWAVHHALFCVSSAAKITFEPIHPDLALGSEFTFRENGVTQVHQAKRQISGQYHWTAKALAAQDVWASAMQHVERGREFHFVSSSSFGELIELTERAREADDLETFTELSLSGELKKIFDVLVKDQFGRTDIAWLTLRSMYFVVCNERILARDNEVLASQLLAGATGAGIAGAIGDVLLEKMGKELSRTELLSALAPQITQLTVAERASISESVEGQAARWKRIIKRELLDPPIQRTETGLIFDALALKRLVLVSGTAGTGKSAVLESVMARLSAAGRVVLPLRLDRLDAFDTTTQIGVQLDLEGSPAEALARAADGGEAVLLIDQLDAVSLASGRTPDNFDAVVDLIEEALASPNIRVLLACRAFDIENDPRIRTFARREDLAELMETVSVELLSDDAVDAAVTGMRLDATKLTDVQRMLLRTPFNLVLLSGVATVDGALDFDSIDALFDAFWAYKSERATRRRSTLRFSEVVSRVATVMSERQTLSVPREILDDGGLLRDAQVLASEHVLAIGDNRVSFFHEAFFDYAFARMWMARTDTIVDFLTASEQELFRRAQVRQVLQYLQPRDPKRFRAEVAALLGSSHVRFHIKETVLAVIAEMVSPTAEDVELMIEVAAAHPAWEERLWEQLFRPRWFTQFVAAGHIGDWLSSDDEELRGRAINFMASSIRDAPEVVTAELTAHAASPHYDLWMRRLARFADLHENRELFDLLLDAVRRGAFDEGDHTLWLSVHELGAKNAKWAIELLRARLIDHHEALALGDDGRVLALILRDYGSTQIVRESAKREPLLFAQTFVPYLQNVMAATARPKDIGDDPIRDRHFAVRFPERDAEEREFDDALLTATARALEVAAIDAPADVQPLLDALSADSHDSAQYLLYRTMTSAPATFAEQAFDLLSQGGRRLKCGYASDSHWVARSLVAAIAPHLSDESHQRLEDLFRDLQNAWERPRWRGRAAFSFLSALDADRLTQTGIRRLGEYQRKFGSTEPAPPTGVAGGFIGSPIERPAVNLMSDEQWLAAMAKYDDDKTDWNTFTGGARELGHALQERVKQEPLRFAQLALRITPETNPSYAISILLGLGEAECSEAATPHIFAAVRRLASLGHDEIDRWLGHAVRRLIAAVPLDIVQLILERALGAADPEVDTHRIQQPNKDDEGSAADLRMEGINSARGSLSESLGDLMISDKDGSRTALIAPHLVTLAGDPVMSVRSCVAHTIAAALNHARPTAYEAFAVLVMDADDALLATDGVERLMMYIGNRDPDVVTPVVQRMLQSEQSQVRKVAGVLACRAAIEWNTPDLLDTALAGDAHTRAGVASMSAHRVTSEVSERGQHASSILMRLMDDEDDEVRGAVAEVASGFREEALGPHKDLLLALIASPAYAHATPQLLIALQEAPDRVDDLLLAAAERFIAVFGNDAGDIRTSAEGDAHYISDLVVRGLAQARDSSHRAKLLDALDLLLEHGVYGIHDAIAQSERL